MNNSTDKTRVPKPPVPPKPTSYQPTTSSNKNSKNYTSRQSGKSKTHEISEKADFDGKTQACCFPLTNAFKCKDQELNKPFKIPPPKPPKPSQEALERARKKAQEKMFLGSFQQKNGIDDIIYADAEVTESSTEYKDDDVSSIVLMEPNQPPKEEAEKVTIRDSKISDMTHITSLSDINTPESSGSYHTAEPGTTIMDSYEESSIILTGDWDLTSSATYKGIDSKPISPLPAVISRVKARSKIDSLPQSLDEKMKYFYESLIESEIEESVKNIYSASFLSNEIPLKPPRTRESPVFITPLTELPRDIFPSPRLQRKGYLGASKTLSCMSQNVEEKASQTMLTAIVKNPYLDSMPNIYQTLIIKPKSPPPRPPPPNWSKLPQMPNVNKHVPPQRPPRGRRRSKTVEVIYPPQCFPKQRSTTLTVIGPSSDAHQPDPKSLYTAVIKDRSRDKMADRPLPPPPAPPRCRSRSATSISTPNISSPVTSPCEPLIGNGPTSSHSNHHYSIPKPSHQQTSHSEGNLLDTNNNTSPDLIQDIQFAPCQEECLVEASMASSYIVYSHSPAQAHMKEDNSEEMVSIEEVITEIDAGIPNQHEHPHLEVLMVQEEIQVASYTDSGRLSCLSQEPSFTDQSETSSIAELHHSATDLPHSDSDTFLEKKISDVMDVIKGDLSECVKIMEEVASPEDEQPMDAVPPEHGSDTETPSCQPSDVDSMPPFQTDRTLDENANIPQEPKSKSSSPDAGVVRRTSTKRVSRSTFYDEYVEQVPPTASKSSVSPSSQNPKSWYSENDISGGDLAEAGSVSGSFPSVKLRSKSHASKNSAKVTKERRSSEFYCELEDSDGVSETSKPPQETSSARETPEKSDSTSVTTSSYSEMSVSSEDSEEESLLVPSDKRQRKIYYIAKEMMTSEEKFVDVLRLLNVDFRSQIEKENKEGHPPIPEEVFNILFSHFPQLQVLNENLLKEFKERVKAWQELQKISDIIVKLGPFLKLYSSYIKDFDQLYATFDDACKRYHHFRNLVHEFEQSPRCHKLALKHFMLKPIQRIPQYRLLLQQYLDHLEPDSPDYEDTKVALEVVSNVADHANDIMKKGDNFQKMLAIQNSLVGRPEIVKPGREFLKEGELWKLSRKGEQPRKFILFNDILLYLTPTQGLYKMNHLLPLTGMKVHVPAQHENEFCIISQTRSIQLAARSQEEQEDWVRAISNAIEENANKRGTFMKVSHQKEDAPRGSLELGKEAPVWVPDRRVTMCQVCTTEFSLAFRRHHCRACGQVVCALCSSNKAPLPYLQNRPERVCDKCYSKLCPADPTAPHSPMAKNLKRPSVLREVCANDQGSAISGYLYRFEPRKGSWKRLWFVLKDKVLYSYKASEDVAALQSMPILGFTVHTFTESYQGIEPGLVFQICQAAIVYIFKATSTENVTRWVKALSEAAVLE